jgi:hypothetical protein
MVEANNVDRDSYYIFKPEFPKLEILRRYITKAQCQEAVSYFNQEDFDPNAYIKGHKSNTWVPLLYQCFQDKRLTALIKILINKGGNISKQPDGDAPPLLFVCDDIYFDYLVKLKHLPPFEHSTIEPNLYNCFLYGNYKRIVKMLKNNLITKTDIEMVHKKHSNLVFEMIDTCVKYLNYYYGAQIKKGDPDANLKKCTMETLEKYVNLCEFISVEYINIDVIELCTQYYLFEILQAFQNKGVHLPNIHVKYGIGGTKEALMRPLVNDYRYEQTCLLLKQEPEKSIYIVR